MVFKGKAMTGIFARLQDPEIEKRLRAENDRGLFNKKARLIRLFQC